VNLVSVTLGELVDAALQGLQGPPELGRRIVLGTTINTSATTYQVSDATLLNATDILEWDDELHFVTDKTDDTATATLTVVRAYAGTTARAHTAGDVGTINPRFSRHQVQRTVMQAFPYLEANRLPLVATSAEAAATVDPNFERVLILTVPAEARHVYLTRSGLYEIPNCRYIDNLPAADYPTGKVVRLPRFALGTDALFSFVYSTPYRWTPNPPVDETATIEMVEGSTDVPVAYTIWQLVSDRETSRRQIDRSEEFPNQLNGESGLALVRLKQNEFYACLDAARRLNPPPKRRQYIGRARYWGGHD